MSRIIQFKKLVAEDFKAEDQEMIRSVAGVVNSTFEQIAATLNKGLKIDDLDIDAKEIEVELDQYGIPTKKTSFSISLKSSCKGLNVTRADNLTSSSVYPRSTPFITYNLNGNIIQILHIAGLQPNCKYRLRVEARS
jgi:hypothetical protein